MGGVEFLGGGVEDWGGEVAAPVAGGGEGVDGEILGPEEVVEGGLVADHAAAGADAAFEHAGPGGPVGSVGAEGEGPGVVVGMAGVEGGGFGAEVALEAQRAPAMDGGGVPVAGVAMGDNGEGAVEGGVDVVVEGESFLNPSVGVEPEVDIVAGEVAREEGTDGLGAEVGLALAEPGVDGEVPAGGDDVGDLGTDGVKSGGVEAEVEEGERVGGRERTEGREEAMEVGAERFVGGGEEEGFDGNERLRCGLEGSPARGSSAREPAGYCSPQIHQPPLESQPPPRSSSTPPGIASTALHVLVSGCGWVMKRSISS